MPSTAELGFGLTSSKIVSKSQFNLVVEGESVQICTVLLVTLLWRQKDRFMFPQRGNHREQRTQHEVSYHYESVMETWTQNEMATVGLHFPRRFCDIYFITWTMLITWRWNMWEFCIKMYITLPQMFPTMFTPREIHQFTLGYCCYVQDRNVSHVPSAVMAAEWCIYQQQSTSQIISLL